MQLQYHHTTKLAPNVRIFRQNVFKKENKKYIFVYWIRQHVVKKLFPAKGILRKLRHYAPSTTLKSVYYTTIYPHLQYEVTS